MAYTNEEVLALLEDPANNAMVNDPQALAQFALQAGFTLSQLQEVGPAFGATFGRPDVYSPQNVATYFQDTPLAWSMPTVGQITNQDEANPTGTLVPYDFSQQPIDESGYTGPSAESLRFDTSGGTPITLPNGRQVLLINPTLDQGTGQPTGAFYTAQNPNDPSGDSFLVGNIDQNGNITGERVKTKQEMESTFGQDFIQLVKPLATMAAIAAAGYVAGPYIGSALAGGEAALTGAGASSGAGAATGGTAGVTYGAGGGALTAADIAAGNAVTAGAAGTGATGASGSVMGLTGADGSGVGALGGTTTADAAAGVGAGATGGAGTTVADGSVAGLTGADGAGVGALGGTGAAAGATGSAAESAAAKAAADAAAKGGTDAAIAAAAKAAAGAAGSSWLLPTLMALGALDNNPTTKTTGKTETVTGTPQQTGAVNSMIGQADKLAALGITPNQQQAMNLAATNTGLSANEQQAQTLAATTTGQWQPFMQAAADWTTQGATTLPEMNRDAYMNPYISSVIDAATKATEEAAARERARVGAIAAKSGNDISGTTPGMVNQADIQKSLVDQQMLRTIGDTTGQLMAQGYDTATAGMKSDQSNLLAAGGQVANLGKGVQSLNTGDIGNLTATGGIDRAATTTDINNLTATGQIPIDNAKAAIGGYGSAITGSGNIGKTTTGTTTETTPAPSVASQLAGVLGMYNLGKTAGI